MSKSVIQAIEAHRNTASKLSAAMGRDYPEGSPVRWKKRGIQEGTVIWNRQPGQTRIKVRNERTGKEVWITAYHIVEAQ